MVINRLKSLKKSIEEVKTLASESPLLCVKFIVFRIIFVYSHFFSFLTYILPDRHVLMKSIVGKIYLNLGEDVTQIMSLFNVFEFWNIRLFTKLIHEGMTIIDAGANHGYFSLLFAKLMNDNGKVLAFEPNPHDCLSITKNINANGYNSISVFQIALSETNNETNFYLSSGGSGQDSLLRNFNPSKEIIKVRNRRLDDFLMEKRLDVDFIKIDVEGSELSLLRGAEKTLQKNRNLKLCIELHKCTDKKEIFKTLRKHQFHLFKTSCTLRELKGFDPSVTNLYAVKVPKYK